MTIKPHHIPVFLIAVIALMLLLFTTPGCAEGGHCELAPDAAVPLDATTACDALREPCCNADGTISVEGRLCGSATNRAMPCRADEPTASYTVRRSPTCDGVSPTCDGPVIAIGLERTECAAGYTCPTNRAWCEPAGTP